MNNYTGLEIAIIGMSGKFPGANDVNIFWQNLKNGVESIEFFTNDELLSEGEERSLIENPSYVNANAYVKDKEFFDAEFFGYLPDEAKLMDPQIRLFHQVCWEALEDAGCDLKDPKNKIGLFAGASSNINWQMYSALLNQEGLVDDFSASHLRNARFLTSKISYAFNLKGTSLFVDTACSTSLVAVHQACRSLLTNDCTIAIAGGITISNKSKKGYVYQEGMINSKDGHCKAFDEDSSGTVSGEGTGVVILKMLKNAIRDRDHIYAIIKGTGINNDGSNKVGFVAPSVYGQVEAIMTAHKWAKVQPDSISYIETHGTGTELGDPIEVEALTKAFNIDKKQFCAIGSVKTNVGHLDVASGVTGLIKTVMALKHKQIPPSLHFKNPNKTIDFANSPFYVNTKLQDWKKDHHPLRAGVSSFGIGGSNVHVVLEEAPLQDASSLSRPCQLLVLSGKTRDALKRNISNLFQYLQNNTENNLANIAYTLQTGRQSFSYRKMFVCRDNEEALTLLSPDKLIDNELISTPANGDPKIAFMFSGQGSQYYQMCVGLYHKEIVFKSAVDKCVIFIKEKYKKDLSSLMLLESTAEKTLNIDETEYTQPTLFVMEYALSQLILSWNITPNIMIGHSIGEYVAACISGVFTLEEALHIVTKRGELMQKVARGKMLSIALSEKDLRLILENWKDISLAAVNSSNLCAVAGETSSIEAFKLSMEGKGHVCRPIRTSHAFHSHMMDEVLKDFKKEFNHIKPNVPKIPFLSNLTGELVIDKEVITTDYWVRQLRGTVMFSKGIETILENKRVVFLEVGPGSVLSSLVSSNSKMNKNHTVINLVRTAKETEEDQYHLLSAIGKLWESGVSPDWYSYYGKEQRYKVSLPTYSFEQIAYPVNVNAIRLIKEQFGSEVSSPDDPIGIYVSTWGRTMLPNSLMESGNTKRCFLLFSGQENFSQSMISELTDQGQEVIEVRLGSAFRVISKEQLEVAPHELSSLWKHLQQASIKVNHIIYCAALSNEMGLVNYDEIENKLNEGYIGLCTISKSISPFINEDKIAITVFNNYIASVFEDDQVNALKSSILSPVKIIPLEMPNLTCKLIDIPYPFTDGSVAKKYLPKFINELFYEQSIPLVAYRNQQRWIPSFEVLKNNAQLSSGEKIIPDGVYIVTGGFGGMGFSIAQDIASKKNANVILIHRSPFPRKSEWTELVLSKDVVTGKELEVVNKIEALIKMEATGSKVDLYQGDISLEEDVKNILFSIQKKYSKINGLIWAAGEVDYGGIILNRNPKALTDYSASKIKGVLLFERYLNFSKLDFVALFSSIGNVFYQSKFGQVGYNAANEFLVAYAAYLEQKLNIHAFAINWCDWFNVGMTVKTMRRTLKEKNIHKINDQIKDGIYPEEGVDVFYQCLENKAIASTIYRGKLAEAISAHELQFKKIKEQLTSNATISSVLESELVLDVKEILLEIFCQFFGKKEIEIDANFFELGGDSLKGMTLIMRINQRINSSLSIGDLYKFPSVKLLYELLSQSELNTDRIHIPNAPEKDYYQLSSAQIRMYILQALNKESIAYNEPQVFWINGVQDKNRLKNAFEKLIEHHESLRTNFVLIKGDVFQKIRKDNHVHIEEFQSDKEGVENIVNAFIRPFDLEKTRLFRVGIIHLREGLSILMLDMHHIITDGVSKNILTKDFLFLYSGKELPELKLHYKDYAEWQKSTFEQQRIIKQKDFWLQEFFGNIPVSDLPLDFERTLYKSNSADLIDFYIDEEETAALKLLEEQGVSMFMIIMSILNIFLSKLTNQEVVTVGVPTSGRLNADLEGIIGMFVNILPIKNYPKGELNFNSFLQEIKLKTLSSLENQEYPYEDLIGDLGIKSNQIRNALFDVIFTYRNFEDSFPEEIIIPGLEFKIYNQRKSVTKFDLSLNAREYENKIYLSFEYRTELFKKETIIGFIKQFKEIVKIVVANKDVRLSDIVISGKKELKLNVSGSLIKSEQYWLKQFSGELPVLSLPSFKPRPLVKTFNNNKLTHYFSKYFLERLHQYSKEQDVTLFTMLMAGINLLLHIYSGQDDIIVGSLEAGRVDLENQQGLNCNTLAIRTKLSDKTSFSKLLVIEKEMLLEAYEHLRYSFDLLLSKIDVTHDTSRSALFDVLMVLQSNNQLRNPNQDKLSGTQVSDYDFNSSISQFDISFIFSEAEKFALTIHYNTDVYDRSLIEQLVVHFESLLSQAMVHPDRPVKELDYLTNSEKQQLLQDFNDTAVSYPSDKTMIDLFEAQVKKTPDNIAVVFEDKKLTYTELNAVVNQLAGYLRTTYFIKRDDLVGIKLERSERMLISILGILKSGAAYVPIDPGYPQDRITYIEEDSSCKALIDELVYQEFILVKESYSINNIKKVNKPGDLAYVIYTSGTTGHPKGVMIEHTSLINRLEWMQKAYPLSSSDVILQKTSYSFDVSVWELLWWMYNGSQVCFLQPDKHKDPRSIVEAIEKNKITVMHFVPSMLSVFLDYIEENKVDKKRLKSLKQVFASGEALTVAQNGQFFSQLPFVCLMNLYGPTEASIDVSYYACESTSDLIPIGKPIDNIQLLILDEFQQLVPIGVIGKLYISGVGLSRGYLNKPDLTTEKFVAHAFKSGARMYDTGDLARWLPDGNIDYLGRTDHQVKIRGFRIELGEIEHSLIGYSSSIKQVVVIAKEINAEKVLVAYIASSIEIDKSSIKEYLQNKLPVHMIPSFYIVLESLPLSPNGKIDRKALPDVSGEDLIKKEYVAPRNEIERKLIKVTASILACNEDEIGINDNFFDLGMNSLKLIKMQNLIESELQLSVTIAMLFEFPNINELSAKVHNSTNFNNVKEENTEQNLSEKLDDFLEEIMD